MLKTNPLKKFETRSSRQLQHWPKGFGVAAVSRGPDEGEQPWISRSLFDLERSWPQQS
jgi:hypothetical protein